MRKSFITAFAITLAATAALAGDAGEEVIHLGPPQDNDVFAGKSTWIATAAAPTSTGRHGNPAAIASEMWRVEIERETVIFVSR